MSFGGGDLSKEYCKRYFPKCYTTGLISLEAKRMCELNGGQINECGCCMCLVRPSDTAGDGSEPTGSITSASVECRPCLENKYNCRGKVISGVNTCPTGVCGRGALCRTSASGVSLCNGKCKPGCKCTKKIVICPIILN